MLCNALFLRRTFPFSFQKGFDCQPASLSPSANSAPNRYSYPACHLGGHPSSLIQVAKFGESPVIVPYEVHIGLNVRDRGILAENRFSINVM